MQRRTFNTTIAAGMLAPFLPQAFAQAPAAAPAARRLKIVNNIAPLPGVEIPGEPAMKAYLLAYFRDEDHSLHFATSTDGYAFTDVNGGAPVLPGKDVAEQKGLRDPHIMRGPDGAFYLAMTDLHIFAKREGLRDTEWERPGEQYGWGNNRALILMKSFDLVHWTHALVHVNQLFPAYADAGVVWAPETIYDPARNKLMVYFTTRHGKGTDYMVYAYANDAFTTLETEPQRLFTYPIEGKGTIDGDITKVGDKYHLYYVAHDKPGGLRHAVSDRINGGFAYDPAKVDPETVACEAPTLWRRIGTQTYVLMYDVFGAKPNNMGFSETTDFVTYRNLGRFNDPGSPMKSTNFTGPKHGAVMHITAAELARLQGYFSGKAV